MSPQTVSGRAYVVWDNDGTAGGDIERILGSVHWTTGQAVAAIEREAQDLVLDALEAAVRALVDLPHMQGPEQHRLAYVRVAAVLEAIQQQRSKP